MRLAIFAFRCERTEVKHIIHYYVENRVICRSDHQNGILQDAGQRAHAASKRGATAEIAEKIGQVLEQEGLPTEGFATEPNFFSVESLGGLQGTCPSSTGDCDLPVSLQDGIMNPVDD